MKESSVEQKAKAYEKALKEAVIAHKDEDRHLKATLERIFPELKESEDENIRKAILELVRQSSEVLDKQNQNNMIAWLEKQKPVKCNEEDNKIRKRLLTNFSALGKEEWGGLKIRDICAWLERQVNTIPDECVFRPVAGCDIKSAAEQAIKQQGVLAKEVVLAFNGAYIPVKGKAQDIIVNEYNSWLEKQGESYTKRDVDNAYLEGIAFAKNELEKQVKPKEYTFKSIPRLLDMIEPSDRATAYCQKLIGALVREGYTTDAKIVGECLKKMNGEDVPMAVMDEQQGELKPIIEMKSAEESLGISSKEYNEIVNDCLFCKSKPANNIEPNFHEGDWITDGEAVFHITSYDIDYGYQLKTQKGTLFHFSNENVENKYHLWTIQDANDGDILQLGEVTAIFKKYIGQEKCICYCSVCEGEFEVPIENREDNIYGCTNTTPATKEQRDTLFVKIKEAGYEWFAGLRELRKLPTPADVGFAELGKAWEEEAKNKKSVTWSVGDENVLEDIEEAIINYWCGDTQDILLDWLKSLRPQNTWKPSQEQMYMLEWLTTNVLDDGIVGNKAKEVLNTLIEQLKSL